MTGSDTVRASRAGDRYHYFWASRQALRLLDFSSGLEVLSIEGAQDSSEFTDDEIIDVGEYYGGRDLATCARLRLVQLKYSPLRAADEVTSSWLENTLRKFAEAYRDAKNRGHEQKIEFALVINRKLSDKVRTSLDEIGAGSMAPTHSTECKLLRGYLGFGADTASEIAFCGRLTVNDGEPDIESVEGALREELTQFLPGGGAGSETELLMDRIARIASTPSAAHTLDRADLLVTLHTSGEELYPAPSKIEVIANAVKTPDVDHIVDLAARSGRQKLLLTAVGGLGKSVLTSLIKDRLDDIEGSVTVVYDCFASGDYRKQSSTRHPHRVGLTQIANEIASRGLCTPLVPAPAVEDRAYAQIFMRKVQQAAKRLERSDALLTVIIDAADNAAIAAKLFGDGTFVGHLFREDWPANARLIALCRPEREADLDLPSDIEVVRLQGFAEPQTLEHLRRRFPDASEEDGAHLHALSGGNPRVQAMVLEHAKSSQEAVASLERVQARPGDLLDALLADQIHAIADLGHLSKNEVDLLCEALAMLHPAVPVDVLANLSGMHADAIRSFVSSIGRGLYLDHDAIQFRDEPTETWFRTAHAMNPAKLREFAGRLAELAERSSYAAVALPQAYFEAGMLVELVELALSDRRVPDEVPEVQRKQIASVRARFALAAALRNGRHFDAALLAIKAGELSGGEQRRLNLYRAYPDLAACFLGQDAVERLCAGRDLATDWPGSNLHIEAVLLAHSGAAVDARSRFRSAFNNLLAISRLDDDEWPHLGSKLDGKMAADLAVASAITDGPSRAVAFVERWRSADRRREVTQHLARRLASLGLESWLSDMVVASKRLHVQIGSFETMYGHGIVPSEAAARCFLDRLMPRTKSIGRPERAYGNPDVDDRAVVWAVLHGLRMSLISEKQALAVLEVHLPANLSDHVGDSWGSESPISTLLGHALRARLERRELELEDVASAAILEARDKSHTSPPRHVASFERNIPPLLPWARLLVDVTLDGSSDSIRTRTRELIESDLKPVGRYETPLVLVRSLAEMAIRIVALEPDDDLTERIAAWLREAGNSIAGGRLPAIRNASRSPHLAAIAIELANRGAEAAKLDEENTSELTDTLAELAQAIYCVSREEAMGLFDDADAAAELVGDDVYERWRALTSAAASLGGGNQPARAYRLFQIAETISRTSEIGVRGIAEPLFALHPASYFAIASRARDRRSLSLGRLLEPLVNSSLRNPNQVERLAMYAFGGQTSWRELAVRPETSIAPESRRVMDRYARFERTSETLTTPKRRSLGIESATNNTGRPDPLEKLRALDFTQARSWEVLFETPLYGDELRAVLTAVLESCSPLSAAVAAAATATRATERGLIEIAKIAARSPATAGTRRALGQLVVACVERFPRSLCAGSYGSERLPDLATITDTVVRDLWLRGFRSLSGFAHQLQPGEYFTLASTLTNVLDPNDRVSVFDALAHLFDELAPMVDASDGSFSSALAPEDGESVGLAGLIWTALGDPSHKRRWEAAHAVLLLVQLGAGEALRHLAEFADGTRSSDAYRDARFPPYDLHSRMWLLLALTRSSLEPNAAILQPFTTWLADVVLGPLHAANQTLAQRTLRTLMAAGIKLSDVEAGALSVVLTPQVVEMSWQASEERPDPLAERAVSEDSGVYPFFLDFQPYWCSTLARAFGTTEEAVASAAVDVAAGLVGYGTSPPQRDPRHSAGVFRSDSRRGQSTYATHGAWPDEDDFDTYAAVHALLTIGGELAASHPALKEEGSDDTYTEWLQKYLPTRPDGRWLSDRRDPVPAPAPERALGGQSSENWRWSLRPSDFEAMAGHGTEWITVHGLTYVGVSGLSEEAHVMSALVPHQTAQSLLVALQCNPGGPWSIRFPTDGDIDPGGHFLTEPPFALTPWIDTNGLREGIDGYNALGRGVAFPPRRPSSDIRDRFDLAPDEDMRIWRAGRLEVFRSEVWNDADSSYGDDETGTRGETLRIRADFLTKLLSELDQTLVIHVDLRRDLIDQHRYGRTEDDEFHPLERSHKVYLISPDGRWTEY